MNLLPNQGIKILSVSPDDGSLRSCHGGDLKWSPPVENLDGSILPGDWTDPVDPYLCLMGYHLTDLEGLVQWFDQSGLRAFLVEFKGKVHGSFEDSRDRKISVESCRLLRSLTDEEHALGGVFLSGEHTVKDGMCVAYDNAKVTASGNAEVTASGNAVVHAFGDAYVIAYDNVNVKVSGNARVMAYGNSKVDAGDNAVVDAYDNTVVDARGNVRVYALGNAGVTAFGDAEVYARGNARVTRNP